MRTSNPELLPVEFGPDRLHICVVTQLDIVRDVICKSAIIFSSEALESVCDGSPPSSHLSATTCKVLCARPAIVMSPILLGQLSLQVEQHSLPVRMRLLLIATLLHP